MIHYSVVIPLKDEAMSIPTLHNELTQVFNRLKEPFELIFVDDGSTDKSFETLIDLQKKDNNIKIIKFRTNFGKSAALSSGFKKAQGEIVVMLDADLQDDPHEIPKMVKKIDEGYDLVTGWRHKREDSVVKIISSFLFNTGTSLLTGVKLHDLNCGLKVMRKSVADELYIHGELHRFIPILAAKRKFKVTEIKVNHRSRQFGTSKYGKLGLGRSWRGIIDLITTVFVTDFSTKPAHFFGSIGLISFLIGFVMDAYVSYIRITVGNTQGRIPLLLAGILLMIIGIQLISTGLIAEMIAHFLGQKKDREQFIGK